MGHPQPMRRNFSRGTTSSRNGPFGRSANVATRDREPVASATSTSQHAGAPPRQRSSSTRQRGRPIPGSSPAALSHLLLGRPPPVPSPACGGGNGWGSGQELVRQK